MPQLGTPSPGRPALSTISAVSRPRARRSRSDGRTYTFQAAPLTDVSGNVLIGANPAADTGELGAAINGTGTPGVQYAASTLATTVTSESATSPALQRPSPRVDSAASGTEIGTTETMLGSRR